MSLKKNTRPVRISEDDLDILKKLSAQRYVNGLDKFQLTPARLLKAAFRIPNVKEILLSAEIKKEINDLKK
jgi:hypothetical protein